MGFNLSILINILKNIRIFKYLIHKVIQNNNNIKYVIYLIYFRDWWFWGLEVFKKFGVVVVYREVGGRKCCCGGG